MTSKYFLPPLIFLRKAARCLMIRFTQVVHRGPALIRDSLAIIGFSAILLSVLAFQNSGLLFHSNDIQRFITWFQPSMEQQLSRLSARTETANKQMTMLMGLNEDSDGAYPQQIVLDPRLQSQQQTLSHYLAKRYRIAPKASGLVVSTAYIVGQETNLDPLLILSVMAVESGLNPFAESTAGAQGLMQVLSRVHEDKLQVYGGKMAALNPVVNIKVGAIVLRDCIRRGRSLEAGLKLYVGATTPGDGGYGAKVMATRAQMQSALGIHSPTSVAAAASSGALL